MEYFIALVVVCVVGFVLYKKYDFSGYRKYLTTKRDMEPYFVKQIVPDTGNLEKIMNRINHATSWAENQFKFATEYKFGDIVIKYTHGGECSRFSGVSFKGVKVPLGTKEREQLEEFAWKIIAKNKEQERMEEEQAAKQVLATL